MGRKRLLLAALAVMGAVSLLGADYAEAKRGMSLGSRGARTFQAPPATPTAPGAAAPIQRSTTPQTAPAANPAARQQAPQRPSMFGNGFAGSLMRGLLIGGLIGMLLGHGLGGLAGLLGLLLQGALIALVVMLVLRFLRRPQPMPAGGPAAGGWPGASRAPGPVPGPAAMRRSALGGAAGAMGAMGGAAGGAAMGAAGSARRAGPVDEIGITPQDLDSFERILGEVQTAFGGEDQATLKALTTPEIFGYYADELRENAEKGVRNVITDVKLLQGDIAESWREGARDYATVAMRFASRDVVVDRASGQFVSGDRDAAGESTELWTFVRDGKGPWTLSAVQTAGA